MSGKDELFKSITFATGDEGADQLIDITQLQNGNPSKPDGTGDDDDLLGGPKPDKKDDKSDLIDIAALQKQTKQPGDDDDIASVGDDDQRSSPFSALAKAFADRGFLNIPTDEEEAKKYFEKFDGMKSFDDFISVFDEDSKLIPEDTLEENQRQYLEAMKAGIPQDEFHDYNVAVTTLEKLDDNAVKGNKAVQQDLIKQYYAVKLKSEEDAAPIAEQMMTREDAADFAIKAKNALLEFNKSVMKAKIEKGQEAQKQAVADEKNKLDKVKEYIADKQLFPDLKLTDVMKEKVINAATKIVAEDSQGRPMNALMKAMADDPEGTNAKLAYLWVQTGGLKNLTAFRNQATTDATRAVEEIASRSVIGGLTDTPELDKHRKGKGKSLASITKLALDAEQI